MDKPKCPDHPKAGTVSARKAGTSVERWHCITCWRDLGFAGYNDGSYETVVVDERNVEGQ